MRIVKKATLLAIMLITALFASFAITGNVAYAEEPPKISNHIYDPGNKMGAKAEEVKERLASLDRSGLHVYVAFPSEYSNDTVSNWNLMALQKSGAPQGSYMLSVVADNPNQTMYLASADNAAKLSQEDLSALAAGKMVPLLNQQKYPEAVLAFLDALSDKAPEMGLGLSVTPWAMIAFLIALIVVIVVLSRVLKARRRVKDHLEAKESQGTAAAKTEDNQQANSNPAYTGAPATPGVDSAVTPNVATALDGEDTVLVNAATSQATDEDEEPRKRRFGRKLGRGKKKDKSRRSETKPELSPALSKAALPTSTGENVLASGNALKDEPPSSSLSVTSTQSRKESNAPAPLFAAPSTNAQPFSPDFKSENGKVPSLAELDQLALARSAAARTNQEANITAQPSPQIPPVTPQAAPSGLTAPSGSSVLSSQPGDIPVQTQPGNNAQSLQPPLKAPLASPLPAVASPLPAAASGSASLPTVAAPVSTPTAHSSVLNPGTTTYLPPEANDDDTQVTSAAQIKAYGQERRDEIARAKARAQAASRFRQEQEQLKAAGRTEQPSYHSNNAPLPAPQGASGVESTSALPAQQQGGPEVAKHPLNAQLTPAATPHIESHVRAGTPNQQLQTETAHPGKDQTQWSPQGSPQVKLPAVSQAVPQVPVAAAAQAIPQLSPQLAIHMSPQMSTQTSRPAAPLSKPALAPKTPRQNETATRPQEHKPGLENHLPPNQPSQPPAKSVSQQPDFTKGLRQADSWVRKGASKLALAQERSGKTVTQPFALALVNAQDAVRAAFGEFATAQLQSRPINQQIVSANLPGPLRKLRDQITHFTNLYHQQTPVSQITQSFEREIVNCREELVKCRLIVERIQNQDPQKAARIGEDVMGAHKLLSRAQNLIEDATAMDKTGQENEVLKATVRTENLLLQARKIVRQASAEEAALQAAEKVKTALTFEEKVAPLSEEIAILMAAVDDYIGVHTTHVGVAARTMLDLANRTLMRLDQPGSHDTQEALRLLQRAKQQTEQAQRLAENDVAKQRLGS